MLYVFLFLYLGISTIFVDFKFVGKIGEAIGTKNREFFGALAYIYPFLMIVGAYWVYKNRDKIRDFWTLFFGVLLLFFSLLILQALILPPQYAGKIGLLFVNALKPYIGLAGLWMIVALLFSLLFYMFKIDKVAKRGMDNIKDLQIRKEVITIEDEKDKNEELLPKRRSVKVVQAKEGPKSEKSGEGDKSSATVTVKKVKKAEEPKSVAVNRSEKKSSEAEEKKVAAAPLPQSDVKIVKELEENKKLLESIEKGNIEKPDDFKLPPLKFLQDAPKKRTEINEAEIDKKVRELLSKLKQFKIEGDVVRTYTGPLVTTFEFKPAPHIKVSKILNLQDDLAMALKAQTIRIQAPIPGKDVVGIEIPNSEFETIYLKEVIQSDIFKKSASPLTLALGKDIVGKPFITDLKKLPHLLIAGTTGSGKSVGINAMVISLLYRNSPDRLKLMMIDPKMLEFSIYNDIPHLLTPVITNSKQAVVALSNMVSEMERRYQLMSRYKTKNIEGFNKKAKKEGLEELPYIIVIIDELADLMMTSGKDVEYSIARLAQMARAAGIHLIVATQRPSVDVVTGLIKANLPARISFRVGQKIDSKVILDSFGAESLLGRGDMLFTPPGANGLIRLHAPWVSEQEIEEIVEFLKSQREPQYDNKFLAESIEAASEDGGESLGEDLDELFEEAKNIVVSERKTSISYLQRRLQIGYNRAARIVEQLEKMGVLSPANAKGNREILV